MTFSLENMAKKYDSWISSFNKVSFECFKTAKPLKNLALSQVQTVRFCNLRQILGSYNFCSANMRYLRDVYAPSDDLFPSQWFSASKVLVVSEILLHRLYMLSTAPLGSKWFIRCALYSLTPHSLPWVLPKISLGSCTTIVEDWKNRTVCARLKPDLHNSQVFTPVLHLMCF